MADRADLLRIRGAIKGKGFKGASGTSASFGERVGSIEGVQRFEADVLSELELQAYDVATQG